MKTWHLLIFLSIFFALWSFNKGYLMTGRLKPAPEMFVFSLILLGSSLVSKANQPKDRSSSEEILDDNIEN